MSKRYIFMFLIILFFMARKTREDCTVDTFEEKHGLSSGTIRNDDGRDTHSDKKIGIIRKEKSKKN